MTSRAWRTSALAAVAAVLAATVLVAPSRPADAQGPTTTPSVQLVLSSLTGVVGEINDEDPDDDEPASEDLVLRVLVHNRGPEAVADLQVAVEVHPRVNGARSVLQNALDGGGPLASDPTVVEGFDVRDGGEVLAGDIAALEVRIEGERLRWTGTEDVYPVEVAVLRGTDVLDRVVTAVVHLTEPPRAPLQTTVVWPLAAPTTRTASGTYPRTDPPALVDGGRLDVLVSALERHPDAGVLLAPDGATMEELADRADGYVLTDGTVVADDHPSAVAAADLLQRIRDLVEASPHGPVVGPYASTDVAALAAGGEATAELAERALNAARTSVQTTLGVPVDPTLYPATTTVTPEVVRLVDADYLLLPYDQVTLPDLGNDPNLPPARMEVNVSTARTQLAIAADPHVASILRDPPVEFGAAVVRQRLVAETALLYLTAPAEEGRALLLLPPPAWDPPAATTQPMLDAVTDAPWLSIGRPDEGPLADFARLPSLVNSTAQLPASVAGELIGVQRLLEGLREATADVEPALDGRTVGDLEDALLRAVTAETLADGGGEALARIARVADVAEGAFGTVEVTQGARVTLTSDTGSVPVTLERAEGGPIDVLIEIDSAGRLLWEDEDRAQRVTLTPGSSRTISFATRAVSRGTFPVRVSVWDPTHVRLLDRAELSVRSTAISTPAVYVVGAVVLLLLVVGARRRRTPKLEVVR